MGATRNYTISPTQIPMPAYGNLAANTAPPNVRALPLIQPQVVATETVILNPAASTPAQSVPLLLNVPSKSIIESKPFEVVVTGYWTKTTGNVAPTSFRLYIGNSMTLTNNLGLPAFVSGVTTFSTCLFVMKATLLVINGLLVGSVKGLYAQYLIAETAITTQAAWPLFNFANDPVMSFMLTSTISPGTTNPAVNVVGINQFYLNL